MARGNERRAIFLDDDDRRSFLGCLDEIAERLQWRLWSYCLMPNHYHLLVETAQPTLARGMRDLNGIYAQRFNRRHERVGHLFQGRYAARLVDRESYLLELARYIVLNPVRAGLCRTPAGWPWSSYQAMLGRAAGPVALAARPILEQFAAELPIARRRYAQFVRSGIGAGDPADGVGHGLFIGDEAFVARVISVQPPPSCEVPRTQQGRKTLAGYARDHGSRDDAIRAAYASGSYTLAEIGRHFGLHYTTVSRIVRRCDNARPDPDRHRSEREPLAGLATSDASIQDLTPS